MSSVPLDSDLVAAFVYSYMGSSLYVQVGMVSIVSTFVNQINTALITAGGAKQNPAYICRLGEVSPYGLGPYPNPGAVCPAGSAEAVQFIYTLYVSLTLLLALFAGTIQFGIGFLGAGNIMNFINRPCLAGYTAGAAVTISVSQMKNIFGCARALPPPPFSPVCMHAASMHAAAHAAASSTQQRAASSTQQRAASSEQHAAASCRRGFVVRSPQTAAGRYDAGALLRGGRAHHSFNCSTTIPSCRLKPRKKATQEKVERALTSRLLRAPLRASALLDRTPTACPLLPPHSHSRFRRPVRSQIRTLATIIASISWSTSSSFRGSRCVRGVLYLLQPTYY